MKKFFTPLRAIVAFVLALTIISYTFPPQRSAGMMVYGDSLTEAEKRMPKNALKGLEVAYGLQVEIMATEPLLKNPTNIDVDEKGRIWVTEAYNYRPAINGNPTSPKGDRIVILEDRNQDGIIDTSKVFYQGPELNAPLGIVVLGKRVIVSQSPYVWNFYDDDGDDRADRKEIMFQGMEGDQHDHGVHAFTFGPDGKLYFNFGNSGLTLKDKDGKVVLDQDGDEIGPKKYKQGMVFRCNPDGTQVECLGDNFRNPYEVAVDSYGTLWQSDNDDDGNKGTRINYVMPYGNYGYTDELTGAGWQSGRTNMEDSIPYRHWHLNDPGAVPNVLQTGAGSPTGILVYEGTLLPEAFRQQPIHCDAGPNVVRAYPMQNQGAGYSAGIINILKGENDRWFRPADVCTAPDGSLVVADWYDPGVGGHQAGDQLKGRIYRVTPAGMKGYAVPTFSLANPESAVAALQSPNHAIRYQAYQALLGFGPTSVKALEALWKSDQPTAMRARAFWLLTRLSGSSATKYIRQAMKEEDARLRMLAIRSTLSLKLDVIPVVKALKRDPNSQVRRECVLALHHHPSADAPALWAELAEQYDGADRWYLEALGLGADAQWNTYFSAYVSRVKDPLATAAGRDLVWRARTDEAIPYLARLAADPSVTLKQRLRYFRAFDFNAGSKASGALASIIEANGGKDKEVNRLALASMDVATVNASPVVRKAMEEVVDALYGTPDYLEMVNRYTLKSERDRLMKLIDEKGGNALGRGAARTLLNFGEQERVWHAMTGTDSIRARQVMQAISGVGSTLSVDLLQRLAFATEQPIEFRKYAAGRIGRSGEGERRVLEILKKGMVPEELIPDVVNSVSSAWMKSVRDEAKSYLPKKVEAAPVIAVALPTVSDLAAFKGTSAKGKVVFMNNCATCHKVNTDGYDFGPRLSEIGSKYDKDGMLKAIVNPSEGISFGFEGWVLKMKDGSTLAGIIASKTETDIDLKMPAGIAMRIKTAQVSSMEQMKSSMMPEGLHESFGKQELADLLAYLDNLKRK